MGPAGSLAHAVLDVQAVEAAVAVGLQRAAEVLQVRPRVRSFPGRRIAIERRRRIGAGGRTIIPHVHPQPAGLGLAPPRIEHRHRRVVGVDLRRRDHVAADQLGQRRHQPGDAADPIGERRALQVDALPGVDLRLPVQRQVIEVLRDRDVGEQARAGDSFVDRARRRRGLHDGRALAASELRPDVADDLEVLGNELELLGDILADLLERAAAVRAGAGRRVDHASRAATSPAAAGAPVACAATMGSMFRRPPGSPPSRFPVPRRSTPVARHAHRAARSGGQTGSAAGARSATSASRSASRATSISARCASNSVNRRATSASRSTSRRLSVATSSGS